MRDSPIFGRCDDRFSPVREAFEKNFQEGEELGASFALCIDGATVVDLWGGFSDVARTVLLSKDEVMPVTSCSKVVIGLCGLMLIDRGHLDLDAPVAKYWPEFAGGGKQDVLVRHVFHTQQVCLDLMTRLTLTFGSITMR